MVSRRRRAPTPISRKESDNRKSGLLDQPSHQGQQSRNAAQSTRQTRSRESPPGPLPLGRSLDLDDRCSSPQFPEAAPDKGLPPDRKAENKPGPKPSHSRSGILRWHLGAVSKGEKRQWQRARCQKAEMVFVDPSGFAYCRSNKRGKDRIHRR